ncbi:hypothetical protein NBN67_19350 [Clostridioides difficile]|uniref:hypothetical protein n=1 Tax=Clostridioides difficile TaxID=1496 RepID=UPI00202F1015|nr:hypothetical protein [Clostridioides difficile]MCM0739692.1 hypothetical protein [Clostridioides difficile]HBF2930513.1 hypothetical protein [Clostridioides difficile]HBF2935897.1 hypothetical protein [Clostridioides difficile]HBZ0282693.1 hypothetical protein [Clostridioides difficile]
MELLICIYVIQLGLVFLFLQRVFIQEKTRAKNNLLNFLKQNQEELDFVNQSEFFTLEDYLFILMFNKEYEIKNQYDKEFRLTENILSDRKSPHYEIVVKYAIAFESLAHEYNNIKEYIEDLKAIRDMRNEMQLALINLLKTVDSIVNDQKKEVALKEKDILLENMKKYNNILSK